MAEPRRSETTTKGTEAPSKPSKPKVYFCLPHNIVWPKKSQTTGMLPKQGDRVSGVAG